MPRIRRWHPVSHDFNRDPEVQDLRHAFGQWMGYVWLEMLSIADRNNGQIKGDRAQVARGLAWCSLSDRPSFSRGKIEVAIQYMLDKGWIEEGTGCFLVRNYSEYHITREHKKSRKGTVEHPLLSYPSEPSPLPPKVDPRDNGLGEKVKEVVGHLNVKAGTDYRPTTGATTRHIRARLGEGRSPEDLKAVVDVKVAEWKGTDSAKWLRPETLFGSKFEGYLQEARRLQVKPRAEKESRLCPACGEGHLWRGDVRLDACPKDEVPF